jgi:hypothetical protein
MFEYNALYRIALINEKTCEEKLIVKLKETKILLLQTILTN